MERYLIDQPIQIFLLSLLAAACLGTLALSARPRWLVRYLGAAALVLVAFTVVTTFRGYTAPPSNYCHYYLGAKYRLDYLTFYEQILAAQGKPLENYRDLKGSPGFGIATLSKAQERAYYGRLLEDAGVEFDRWAPVADLRRSCAELGLFERDGRRLLAAAGHDPQRIDELVHDVGVAGVNVRDCGFNGSPFYILLRQLDPAVHRPLSLNSFRASVLLELVFLLASSWLLAAAFGLGAAGGLIFLLFALGSWDFFNWSIPGLPAMPWFFPVALVMFCLTRQRYAWAGVAAAVALLLKIFPGLVALPVVVALAVKLARRQPPAAMRKELVFLSVAGVAVLILALLAQLQTDWLAWAEKIRRQFVAGDFFAPNDICFYKSWVNSELGGEGSAAMATAVVWVWRAGLLAFLTFLLWRGADGRKLALGAVAALTMMPWISREFLQYYTFPYAIILAILFRQRRAWFYGLVPLLLLNQLLVDFPHQVYIREFSTLVWVKTLPYLVLPLAFMVHLFLGERTRRRSGEG